MRWALRAQAGGGGPDPAGPGGVPLPGVPGICLEPAGLTGNEPHEISSVARPRGHPRLEGEDKTKGGIIIPDTVKEKPQEGEVIAVGPGARDESGKLVPLDLKIGDLVLFGKWSGTEVEIDGKDLTDHERVRLMGVLEDKVAAKAA